MSGTRQLIHTVFNTFPRPIESAMESNRLVRSGETCENCHTRARPMGNPVRILAKFASDETNTRSYTVLTMTGAHTAHLHAGVTIRYAAADPKRQTIPWVQMTDAAGKITTYQSPGLTAAALAALRKFDMQCVDCHNRPAHSFELPERAIDRALADGRIAPDLPFVRNEGLKLLSAPTATAIAPGLEGFYSQTYPALYAARRHDIARAAAALTELHTSNVFPDLKVTWGTYVNNLGHADSPGCFRCHDGDHMSTARVAISNDCAVCHQVAAVEESNPAVLKSLGYEVTAAR